MKRSPATAVTVVISLIFLSAGIAGFIPGLTEGLDEIRSHGRHSEAYLLGLFQVSYAHNVVHLLFGVVGLLMARRAAKAYLVVGGLCYLATWLYGVRTDYLAAANWIPLNDASNWLHLGLGIAMVALGLLLPRQERELRTIGHGSVA